MIKNIGIFLVCLIGCQIAGGIGTIATIPNIPTWYTALHKPSFNPPNYLFGPVWTLLYTLMSVSLFLIIRSSHHARGRALTLFFIQLGLNTVWSFLFFQYHLLLVSLIEILIMLSAIIGFAVIAYPINRKAAYCFIPYIAWVSFASLLNAAIWYLN